MYDTVGAVAEHVGNNIGLEIGIKLYRQANVYAGTAVGNERPVNQKPSHTIEKVEHAPSL